MPDSRESVGNYGLGVGYMAEGRVQILQDKAQRHERQDELSPDISITR